MKKIFTIACMLIIFGSLGAGAQILQFFKVSEGYAEAKTKVETEGLSNPELLFCGAVRQLAQVPIIGEVQIEFKIEDGTANAWVYMFRSQGDTSNLKAVAVSHVQVLGTMTQDVPVEQIIGGGAQIDKTKPFNINDAINSDLFAETLRSSSDFISFLNAHPNPSRYVVSLFINSYIPELNIGDLYWGSIIEDGDDGRFCSVHAVTRELSCSITDVAEDNEAVDALEIFPNPAAESINIRHAGELTIDITDVYGNNILRASLRNSIDNIDLSAMSSGVYYIKYISSGKLNIYPFIIVK
ncbi:MAG: Por Secre tail protein [Bacteroidota bacterium]|nr:Por Secre tail protein [Bacteroidota bacterium]